MQDITNKDFERFFEGRQTSDDRKTSVQIKSQIHLNDVLTLMRNAQKESFRFRNFQKKDCHKTARYWEEVIDSYLNSDQKNNCNTVLRIL